MKIISDFRAFACDEEGRKGSPPNFIRFGILGNKLRIFQFCTSFGNESVGW